MTYFLCLDSLVCEWILPLSSGHGSSAICNRKETHSSTWQPMERERFLTFLRCSPMEMALILSSSSESRGEPVLKSGPAVLVGLEMSFLEMCAELALCLLSLVKVPLSVRSDHQTDRQTNR